MLIYNSCIFRNESPLGEMTELLYSLPSYLIISSARAFQFGLYLVIRNTGVAEAPLRKLSSHVCMLWCPTTANLNKRRVFSFNFSSYTDKLKHCDHLPNAVLINLSNAKQFQGFSARSQISNTVRWTLCSETPILWLALFPAVSRATGSYLFYFTKRKNFRRSHFVIRHERATHVY